MRQLIIHGRPAALLLALALTHGLIASSLLVECIPADGRSLVELIGQDPCHHPLGDDEAHSGGHRSAALQSEGNSSDPCLDLSLESYGISACAPQIQPSSNPVVGTPADASHMVEMASPAPGAEAFFKLAREPEISGDGDSPRFLSLRI